MPRSSIPRRLLFLLLLTIVGCVLQPSFAVPVPGRKSKGGGSNAPRTNHTPAPARAAQLPAINAHAVPSTSSRRSSSPPPPHHGHTETRSSSPAPQPPTGPPATAQSSSHSGDHSKKDHTYTTPKPGVSWADSLRGGKTPSRPVTHPSTPQVGPPPGPAPGHPNQQASPGPPRHPTPQHLDGVRAHLASHQTEVDKQFKGSKLTHVSMKIPVHPGTDPNIKMHPKVLEEYAKHAFEATYGKHFKPGRSFVDHSPTVFAATHIPGSSHVYIHSNIKTDGAQADMMKKVRKYEGLEASMKASNVRPDGVVVDAEQGALMNSLAANHRGPKETWKNTAKEHSVGVFGYFPQGKTKTFQGHDLCPMCQGSMKELGVLNKHDYGNKVQ